MDTFGFEWSQIYGLVGKEVMFRGHIFGRFQMPATYFNGKVVMDVGCGNGRIGRLVVPHAKQYLAIDLSQAVYSSPSHLKSGSVQLVRPSGTNLLPNDAVADVIICWGVPHHMDEPERALNELKRVTKPTGEVLFFIYTEAYAARENINRFVKYIPDDKRNALIETTFDYSNAWREVDIPYADVLSQNVFLGVKQSRGRQIF